MAGSWISARAALVTGAAQGLGRAFADALGAAGADLALCDVRPAVADVAADLAARHSVAAHAWVADVAVPAEVWCVVDETVAALGGVDILVNNAGIWAASTATDPVEHSAATFDAVFAVNTRAPFLFGRALMPIMRERGGGSVVNVVTDHVYTEPRRPTGGGRAMDAYDASKWALNGLTLAWVTSPRCSSSCSRRGRMGVPDGTFRCGSTIRSRCPSSRMTGRCASAR